jgi:hypothetical protein
MDELLNVLQGEVVDVYVGDPFLPQNSVLN